MPRPTAQNSSIRLRCRRRTLSEALDGIDVPGHVSRMNEGRDGANVAVQDACRRTRRRVRLDLWRRPELQR
jgi:hypothetical protein